MGTHTSIPMTGYIQDGTRSLDVQYAFANIAAAQTDSEVVAAVSEKRIRVIAAAIVCGATATNITFNSKGSGAGTAITCTFQNAANGGEILTHDALGWFQTAFGEALTATTGAGSTTGVQIAYVEVPR